MTNDYEGESIVAIPRLIMVLLVLSALLALTATIAWAAPPSQDPVGGEQAWAEASCKNCHGDMGQGLWAGPLAGHEKTAEEWIQQVRSPRRIMPIFSPEKMTDETIINMHAYLTALDKPAGEFSPADAGLPADAPAGQQLMVQKRCVACHTTTGPINGFINRGETPTVDVVIAQLRTPRNNMPSFGVEKVSDEDAALITEFLVSQISAPADLPKAGGESTLSPLIWLLAGLAFVLLGLLWRRLAKSV